MALSNAVVVSGILGVVAGGLLGAALGKRISEGTRDSPMPEALGLFGALGGGILFAAIGNNIGATTSSISSSTSNTVVDNTQNANGLQKLPPPGA
jgi:phosphate/sulfate permease